MLSLYRIFRPGLTSILSCVSDNEHLLLPNGDLVIINVKRKEEYSCTVKNTLTEQLAKSEALQVHVSGKSSARLKLLSLLAAELGKRERRKKNVKAFAFLLSVPSSSFHLPPKNAD